MRKGTEKPKPRYLNMAVTVEIIEAIDREAARRTLKLGGTHNRRTVVLDALSDAGVLPAKGEK